MNCIDFKYMLKRVEAEPTLIAVLHNVWIMLKCINFQNLIRKYNMWFKSYEYFH